MLPSTLPSTEPYRAAGRMIAMQLAKIGQRWQRRAATRMPTATGDIREIVGQPVFVPLFKLYQVCGWMVLCRRRRGCRLGGRQRRARHPCAWRTRPWPVAPLRLDLETHVVAPASLRQIYGKIFKLSFGPKQFVIVSDPEMAKQVSG